MDLVFNYTLDATTVTVTDVDPRRQEILAAIATLPDDDFMAATQHVLQVETHPYLFPKDSRPAIVELARAIQRYMQIP